MLRPQCGHFPVVYATTMVRPYKISMIAPLNIPRCSRASAAALLLLTGIGLSGCAGMSDGVSSAFVDPAKYNQYDCKQLENERKALGIRAAELQGLMAKADTGVGGALVGELAYRNDYVANRAQTNLVNEVYRRDRCAQGGPGPQPLPGMSTAPAGSSDPAPSARSRGAIY